MAIPNVDNMNKNVLLHNHHKAPRFAEIMVKPGKLSWGALGWVSTGNPTEEGTYAIHYAWDEVGPEFVGVDHFVNGQWGRRWCDYPKFEWCAL